MNTYLLFKSIHLIAVISWMAGLLYLPRIFVYHAETKDNKIQNDIFKTRAINQREGCILIVRPDQHIANILSLGSYNTLMSFFKNIMLPII